MGSTSSSMDLVIAAVSSLLESPKVPPSRMFAPIPSVFGGLSRDREGIAGHHLDLHAHLGCDRDGGLGIFTRRIEQRQHAKKLPLPVAIRPGHAERTKTTGGEVVDSLADVILHRRGIGRQF